MTDKNRNTLIMAAEEHISLELSMLEAAGIPVVDVRIECYEDGRFCTEVVVKE